MEQKKKPQVFRYPIFMRAEAFEVFASRYRMFDPDPVLDDMLIRQEDGFDGYVGVWYKTQFRRDADYIRCLRYLVLEAYRGECVFTEPNFRKPIPDDDDFVMFRTKYEDDIEPKK